MKNIAYMNSVGQAGVQASGSPRFNHLMISDTPNAGDTFTITADGVSDVYEFRGDSPPTGGTPGRIWIYSGGILTQLRVRVTDAILGVIDEDIVRTADNPLAGTNRLKLWGQLGETTDTVAVCEWSQIPGDDLEGWPQTNPSEMYTTLTATANLTAWAGDIWDQEAFYNSQPAGPAQFSMCTITLTAAMIAHGALDVPLPFTAVGAQITNLMRPQIEATTVTDHVVITLAGGAAPNNQPNDVLHIIAYA